MSSDPETRLDVLMSEDEDDGEGAETAHRKKTPWYTVPLTITELYIDGSFTGPSFIYQPAGESAHYLFQLFRLTQDPTGQSPTTFDFYGSGIYEYIYVPFVQTTTAGTTGTYSSGEVVVQTDGVSSGGGGWPVLDSSPQFYKTTCVTLNAQTNLTFRHRILTAPLSSATTYIPDAAAVRYRSGGPSQPETMLRLHNVPGQSNPVDYVWRKINTAYNTGTSNPCPVGTCCGPEDLFLQSM